MPTPNTEQLRQLLLADNGDALPTLSAAEVGQMVQYYELVLKWNPQLHLTTLTQPAEFWCRHLFEAIFLTQHLEPAVTEVWDIGSGLGIPGIPLAILRPAVQVNLVEAQHKKAVFLDEVCFRLGLPNCTVRNQRLETLAPLPPNAALSARAVERMETLLPNLLYVGRDCRQFLFLGGASLAAEVDRQAGKLRSERYLVPGSSASFLLNLTRST